MLAKAALPLITSKDPISLIWQDLDEMKKLGNNQVTTDENENVAKGKERRYNITKSTKYINTAIKTM